MKTMAFLKSDKENENRRVLLPDDIGKINHPEFLFFEKGYGEVLFIGDEEYARKGCGIVSREEGLKKDIIVDQKFCNALYVDDLTDGATVFGWIHAILSEKLTDKLLRKKLRVIAWENMFYKGEHIFKHNNEMAGFASLYHAFLYCGKLPGETKAAVIGNGNTSKGALDFLYSLGADVDVYTRKNIGLLGEKLPEYDVIVNCVLWDLTREDHLISRSDLKRMKRGSMIVDVSCEVKGGIESCALTTIANPVFYDSGVLHYAVDHSPTLFHKSFSVRCSSFITPYINDLVEEKKNQVLEDATIINDGVILDGEIIKVQHRQGGGRA